ncbi:hypothetical protein ACFLRN_08370 [Thermoproteota archaeon]
MKRRLFSLAVCLFLFVGLFSVSIIIVNSAAGDGIVEVDLNVRGTFLRAMDDWPYFGPGDYQYDSNLELQVGTHTDFHVEEPTIIDLQTEGFNEGDKISISWLGGVYPDGAWNPSNPGSIGYGLRENEYVPHGGLLGLFSTTPTLGNIDSLNRVPGAIEFGSNDFLTPDTWWKDGRPELSEKLRLKGIDWYDSSMKTDIPEDFKISPYTGMKIEIPRNARFMFLSLIDAYYRDNYESPNGLVVTIEKDTDEDGLPDHWEINGIDTDNDGTIDLDLPALGADWEHKDIFVEIDYMSASRPNQFALDSVIDAFDNSPVTNPDMVSGINLHVMVDEIIPYKEVLSGFDEFYTLKSSYFGTQNERLDQKTVEAKKKVFRYCLSVDKIWLDPPTHGCPGISEGLACDDFILATGTSSLSTVENQAAVFMHELGHSLGLAHGGGDQLNYKPNYLSIMNYRFQYAGLLPSRPLDYSRRELPPIDETNINEAVGIGEATKTVWYATWETPRKYYCSSGAYAIDWNNDGNITSGLHLDLNNDYNVIGSLPSSRDELLAGYNDWVHLVYRFRGTPLYRRSATPDDYHIELTIEEIEQITEEAKNIIEVPIPESYNPDEEKRSIEIDLSSRGTFLRAEPFQGSPSGGSAVEDPAIVNLVEEGFEEGDSITISYSGQYHYRAFWDNGELAEIYTAEEIPLLGLFSASEDLNPIDKLNRVPGAIDYGEDIITDPTYFKHFQTDIPEDFKIEPHTGAEMKIPEGAKYLFLCIYDGFYPDDVGDIRISIQPNNSSAFPFELIIILAIALCVVILLILLLNKRKKKKDQKPLKGNSQK